MAEEDTVVSIFWFCVDSVNLFLEQLLCVVILSWDIDSFGMRIIAGFCVLAYMIILSGGLTCSSWKVLFYI